MTLMGTRIGFYNGGSPAGTSQNGVGIGRFRWNGGRSFERLTTSGPSIPATIVTGAGGTPPYGIKTPRALKVGSTYRVYFDIFDTAGYFIGIGLATGPTDDGPWTYQGKCLSFTASLGIHGFPVVIEDPDDPDTSQRFKMWKVNPTNAAAIQYWYSPTGLADGSWTLYGNALTQTQSWEWDSSNAAGFPTTPFFVTGSVLKVGSTWYLYYSFYGGGTPGTFAYQWNTGVAQFTNPKSSYTTKTGPLLPGTWFTKETTLAASASVGATQLTLTNAAVFTVGDSFYVGYDLDQYNPSGQWQSRDTRQITVKAGNVVTLDRPLAHAQSSGYKVRHVLARSNILEFIWYDADALIWRALGTPFRCAEGLEQSLQAEAPAAIGPWSILPAYTPAYQPAETDKWDGTSAENPIPFIDRSDPFWSLLYAADPPVFGISASIAPATEADSAQALSYGLRTSGLTLDPDAYWQQSGTALTVHATVGQRREVTGVVTSSTGGQCSFRGADASDFEVSLDGIDWAASVTVPTGDTPIWLSAQPTATGIISAELGVPA